MQFLFHGQAALPRLAWCAQATLDSDTVDVWHGTSVEARRDSFVEGIWDGPFTEHGFDARCLMGSGGLRREGGVVFASPWHTLENLFLFAQAKRVVVSNSLPFLLERCGLTLDIRYPYYRPALWSIRRGIKACTKEIPTAEGVPIRLIRHANVRVDGDLRLTWEPKASLPDWEGFANYRGLVSAAVSRLTENASSPSRQRSYELLATISSGYDSPAAASLAAGAGCRQGVTFDTGLEYQTTGRRVSDSGREIGSILGLEMEEFRTDGFEIPGETVSAEFAACGDGFDLQFATFEPRLSGVALFTGHPGSYWDPQFPRNNELARQDVAGISLNEFRLRTGFVHVPVPSIFGPHQPKLVDLSRSPEMRAWSLGGEYDRPVPRRIVEEMGVPRTLFGQSKKGSFQGICMGRRKWNSTPEFREFSAAALRQRPYSARLWHLGRCRLDQATLGLKALVGSRLGRNPLRGRTRFDVSHPGPRSVLVQWGVHVVQRRYQLDED